MCERVCINNIARKRRYYMASIINKTGKFFIIILAVLVGSACSTAYYINKKEFSNCQPKNIGIVIGHDLSVKATMSGGEEFLLGFTFGLSGVAGLIVDNSLSRKYYPEFLQQINDMVSERINQQMLGKGYTISLLKTKPKQWHFSENQSNKKEVFPNLIKTYELEPDIARFDAILFFEYWLQGRLPGRLLEHTKLETLNIENMQLRYVKSKIFVYDTKSGKRLYYDLIQRGYSSTSEKTVFNALDTIVNLESMPK